MVFASLIFLYIFLPLNVILYYITKNLQFRNAVLIVFSLVFYAWGEPVWIVLLIFSASIDYFHGLIIERWRGGWQAKAAVVSSLVLNLGLLGIFKYSGFLYENINLLLGTSFPVPAFALPIGISFYSFQTISYTIDIYRDETPPQRSYWKFLLFVSMYHQLVAGPIVRYQDIAREIDHRVTNWSDVAGGVNRFAIGLGKKVLVANTAGQFVVRYLDSNLHNLSTPEAWFGICMFTIQIYYDFSGYSDMAIGMGRMFGFHYKENFNYPYTAVSVTDFWRRWHISLSSFFRDYLYIPLGGNRKHQYFNLLVVWFLTGLWHGASWNFVFWGVYFGALIAIERLFLKGLLERLPLFVSHLYLLLAVVFGWTFFYFTDLSRLTQFWRVLFGMTTTAGGTLWIVLVNNIFWVVLACLFCAPVVPWLQQFLSREKQLGKPRLMAAQIALNIVILILCTALLVGQSYNPFLYYRF